MSDISEHIAGGKGAGQRVCRVSYILNNAQPVRSTIIGDQPLFYMDLACGIDDEDDGVFFDPSELSVLENEIQQLKKEIQSFERNAEVAQKADDAKADFRENTYSFTGRGLVKTGADDVAAIKDMLGKSRMGKAYLDFAAKHGVEIILSGQVSDASYERKGKSILINPVFSFEDRVILAARELRRHWQHRQGALINPLLFHPDNAVLINRAQCADLIVSMIRVGWELQLAGHKEAWERIDSSSMNDLTRAFSREAFMDFRTLNNGQAAAAVFETWFLSERCRMEDKKLIKQMLADYQGYVFDHGLSDRNSVTPALICALGEAPFGKNYLAPHATTIIKDQVFTEVRDRSNANFLWFIKFERSFRETEQELQNKPGQSRKADVRSAATSKQDAIYENPSAEIVRIFPDAEPHKSGDKSAANGKILPPKSSVKRTKRNDLDKSGGANVVYLRRWSGRDK